MARGPLALHYHLVALQGAAALARVLDAAGRPLPAVDRAAVDRLARFVYAQCLDDTEISRLAGARQSRLPGPVRPCLAEASGLEVWG